MLVFAKDGNNIVHQGTWHSYVLTNNPTGTNKKFWVTNKDAHFDVKASWLFKSPKLLTKCYGEVMCSDIARAADFRHVDYYMAELKEGDDSIKGIMCPSYRTSIDDFEMSGFEAIERYRRFVNAGNNGIIVGENNNKTVDSSCLNTVYGYVDQLRTIYPSLSEANLSTIKLDLLKLALFDYLTCQTDRHWKNVTFTAPFSEGLQGLRVAKTYDNENSFLMSKSPNWFENFYKTQLQKTDEKCTAPVDPLVRSVDRVPRLGIYTSTVMEVEEGDNLIPKKHFEGMSSSPTEVFEQELATEIHSNQELRDFYNQLKSLDIKETLK